MTIQKANPITSHSLFLMPPTAHQAEPFGWIQLLNGVNQAGYIYLITTQQPKDPHLSFDGSYIVTNMPMASLPVLLDILRNEQSLQIRFFDPEAAGISPSVFIEPGFGDALKTAFHAPDEAAGEISQRLNL